VKTLKRIKAQNIHMRFMGRVYKDEIGGAWLVGYKIYFGNKDGKNEYVDEMDSKWHAFPTAEAGKAWLNKQAREITERKALSKWIDNKDKTYYQMDIIYKKPKLEIVKWKWMKDYYKENHHLVDFKQTHRNEQEQ